MLPIVMEHNVEECPVRYMMLADAMGMDVRGKDPLAAARLAVQAVKDLKARIGLTQTLKDFGITDDRDRLMPTVELAASDSQVGYNPRYLEEEDLIKLYIEAL
jgi:alcohol dehydrogenase